MRSGRLPGLTVGEPGRVARADCWRWRWHGRLRIPARMAGARGRRRDRERGL